MVDNDSVPLLGAYAAKQCPYRIFREHDPTEEAVAAPPDEALQQLFDDGIAFEADIVTTLLDLYGPDNVAAIPSRDQADHDARRDATDTAIEARTPIILGALMRPDTAGRRLGEIDILVATGQTVAATGRPEYRAIDVKSHRCTTNAPDTTHADVHDLQLLGPAPAAGLAPKYREDDCLQLAHYHRVLQAQGLAAADDVSRPRGGILGSERIVAWFDLDVPAFATLTPQESDDGIAFHKRQRTAKRTALDRYDFEFGFRLRMADAARVRGDRTTPPPVLPVSVRECDRCPWHDVCHSDLRATDDVSLVTGVNYPEWRVHRYVGVDTVTALAALDPDDLEHLTQLYRETPLKPASVVGQIQSARAEAAGRLLVAPDWTDDLIPRGDIEIDLDMENDAHVYLWGARLSRTPTGFAESAGTYVPFASFDPLDADGEADLVQHLWSWLSDLMRRADAVDMTVRIYTYSSVEASRLRTIGSTVGLSDPIDELLASEAWVDLLPLMRQKYWSNWGHGLKVVAAASGFNWRDDDPGGFASIGWYRSALAGIDRQAHITRLLAYNEDDCAATAALRDPTT